MNSFDNQRDVGFLKGLRVLIKREKGAGEKKVKAKDVVFLIYTDPYGMQGSYPALLAWNFILFLSLKRLVLFSSDLDRDFGLEGIFIDCRVSLYCREKIFLAMTSATRQQK